MSDFQPPDETQTQAMEDAIAMVKQDLQNAQSTMSAQGTGVNGAINGIFVLLGGGQQDAMDAMYSATAQWSAQFDTWSGSQKQSVLSGDLSLAKWFPIGEALHNAVASTGTDVSNWTWSGVVSKTAAASVQDVKDAANKALPYAAGTGLLIAAVGFLYVLWVFRR